jgi:hypothetical protein
MENYLSKHKMSYSFVLQVKIVQKQGEIIFLKNIQDGILNLQVQTKKTCNKLGTKFIDLEQLD